MTAAPNPNNGATGVNSGNPSVRVRAAFDDLSPSTIKTGELFIDTVGADGSGVPMAPSDGIFDTVSELGYADIPLTTIAQLSQGDHTIYVHGKDSAGNWGGTASVVLVIDKIGPTTSGVTLTPPAANAQAVTVSADASDVASGNSVVTGGEFFVDAVGANGSGTAMSAAAATSNTTITGTIPAAAVAALSVGNHTVHVHGRDAAGNWGARVS